MSVNSAFRVSVLPGDGIGAEVIDPTVEILKKLEDEIGGFALTYGNEKAGAAHYPDIEPAAFYVDATALNMVRQPWMFDVMVTENMFGDILSDLGAGLMGGMGMAPSADIGEHHAVFQPCHGSAPDIVGQGKANPVATFLSAAMMLEWLGERHQSNGCTDAADKIRRAVETVYADGIVRPPDIGGTDGTDSVTSAVIEAL